MTTNHENYFSIFRKWKKVNELLQFAQHTSCKFFYQKRVALIKKWRRYLKKLISAKDQLVRAISIAGISACMAYNANAQDCNRFYKNAADPLQGPLNNFFPYYSNKALANDFVDIDNDGDLDAYGAQLTGASQYRFVIYKNIGDKYSPVFDGDTSAAATGIQLSSIQVFSRIESVQFADVDGDGDYDLFFKSRQAGVPANSPLVTYFENVGTKEHAVFEENYNGNPFGNILRSTSNYMRDQQFIIADIDDDGDYDLYSHEEYYGWGLQYYKNVGNATNPVFESSDFNFDYPYSTFYNATFYDWDGDGLTDMFISSTDTYLRNTGTIGNPAFSVTTEHAPMLIDSYVYNWVDLNGDGAIEVYTASGYASLSPASKIETTVTNTATLLHAFPKKTGLTYQWKRNGIAVANGNKDSLYVTRPGKYTVDITSPCATTTSNFYTVKNTVSMATAQSNSISENIKTNNPVVYPNPFNNDITIKLPSTYINATLIITDVHGKTLMSQKLNRNTIQLGKNFATGIYFLEIMQQKSIVYKQKIIKQ